MFMPTQKRGPALNGFAEATKDYRLPVEWVVPAPEKKTKLILEEILSQNPIPSYQNDPDRVYGLEYDGIEVHFSVGQNKVLVKKITFK